MSSLDNYIKFALDIKDQNIVFEDYFFRLVNGYKQKGYQAIPSCSLLWLERTAALWAAG